MVDLRNANRHSRWVCIPCRDMTPLRRGYLHIGGAGVRGRVWCPWCSDAMDPWEYDRHGPFHARPVVGSRLYGTDAELDDYVDLGVGAADG